MYHERPHFCPSCTETWDANDCTCAACYEGRTCIELGTDCPDCGEAGIEGELTDLECVSCGEHKGDACITTWENTCDGWTCRACADRDN